MLQVLDQFLSNAGGYMSNVHCWPSEGSDNGQASTTAKWLPLRSYPTVVLGTGLIDGPFRGPRAKSLGDGACLARGIKQCPLVSFDVLPAPTWSPSCRSPWPLW